MEDITRFATRDAFASYTGTAPIEVSSGQRVVHRLSQRGNRRLNHAIHMVAVTQIRNRGTDGRRYYDKKISEGKTPKEALRALKRRISNTIYSALWRDARAAAAATAGPGGQPFMGEIDRGLAKSRTGLVLITPALLERVNNRGVSDKELSELLARDLLIPVVHGTT